jgi:hypothetical protein
MVKKIPGEIYLSIIFVVLVLWQMLLPGYILTLDMVFTPKLNTSFSDGSFYNSLPLKYLFKFLNLFWDGWIIQKIMLIALFFCLFYLAVKFLPIPKKCYANYWGALFYAINPFVYERFLAGHWTHLFAYAFLPPFIYYLFKFSRNPSWQSSSWLFGWLFLIGIFSLHFLVMGILILMPYLLYIVLKNLIIKNKKQTKDILKFTLIFGIIFIIINSYWLIPCLFNSQKSIINNFTPQILQAFKTAKDAKLGTGLNVLALYGFWEENQPWAKYWLWPKDHLFFWLIIFGILAGVIAAGIITGLRKKEFKNKTIFFLVLAIFAFIFSCGLGDTLFKSINQWLFANINFWRGFRDSQKWSAWLALSYAYFGSLGIFAIVNWLKNSKLKQFALIIIYLIPVLYAYPMLGGFARQLLPVWYPQSWQKVNQILNQDKSKFKVLFLPWHQYLSFNFNHNLIIANPAKLFFDQQIIQSENMEINNVFSQSNSLDNERITNLIVNEERGAESQVEKNFKKQGIKYIIWAQDLKNQDIFKYSFLDSIKIRKIYDSSEIVLYELLDF